MAKSKRDQNMLRQLVASGNLVPVSDGFTGKIFDRKASQAAAIAARRQSCRSKFLSAASTSTMTAWFPPEV